MDEQLTNALFAIKLAKSEEATDYQRQLLQEAEEALEQCLTAEQMKRNGGE